MPEDFLPSLVKVHPIRQVKVCSPIKHIVWVHKPNTKRGAHVLKPLIYPNGFREIMGTGTKSGENSYYCCPIKSLEFIHHVHGIEDDLFSVAGLSIPKEQIVTRHLCNYRCAFTDW
ncbi:hypothetical protein Pcinc_005669 [Petrolisthes cinctipes]|uniref:Uncharacterized protein n=1 Tax=Petrolisthes cinctipes TaxID=88211 RepID=A0AAE1GCW5_PETCI|nr:hypothetical protein Pcinc_005669 [Petrolisthes cinctipes]